MHFLHQEHTEDAAARLLARVLREVLAEERFARYADLWDAWKFACARLHIPWTNDAMNAALALVESNTNVLVDATPLPRRVSHVERDLAPLERPLSHPDAVDALARLSAHCTETDPDIAPKTIAPARWRDADRDERAYEAARARAAEMGVELTREEYFR